MNVVMYQHASTTTTTGGKTDAWMLIVFIYEMLFVSSGPFRLCISARHIVLDVSGTFVRHQCPVAGWVQRS